MLASTLLEVEVLEGSKVLKCNVHRRSYRASRILGTYIVGRGLCTPKNKSCATAVMV